VTATTIFIAILSLSHLVLVLLLIPVFSQIIKTAKQAEKTLATIDTELAPLLVTTQETVEELQVLTSSVNSKIEMTDGLFNEIGEASHIVATTSSILKDSISPILIQLAGITSGFKAFTTFFKR
jgi:uncharacterized protein YoxC